MERLDKLLCAQGLGSRSDVKEMVRKGRVLVNGIAANGPAQKIDPAMDAVLVDGRALSVAAFRYGIMNKPSGILTAAADRKAKTVVDLLPPVYRAMGLMPVGRLDKDARGLLLFTTDGPMAHFLLSPRRHVKKEYRVLVDGPLDERDVKAFESGIALSDFTAQPAQLFIEESNQMHARAVVTLKEGKFHQVKRMFLARGRTVTDLQRISFGGLHLEENLPEGAFRELTEQEVDGLRKAALGEAGAHG